MVLGIPISQITREYDALSNLFNAQPMVTQHFLNQQARAIVLALVEGKWIRYQLPDRVILEGGEIIDLPPVARRQTVGISLRHTSHAKKRAELIQHLNALEQGLNPGLAVCARLLRYALGYTIVHQLLPDGRPVRYRSEDGDDIPSIPLDSEPPSALLAATDAVTELEATNPDGGRLQVPYMVEARRFFLPQWVAFGEDDHLLTGSFTEAEACIASLENAVRILQDAIAICPSVVVDETYQRKRAGLLGQLVNQGRALARTYTREIITKIRSRAEAGTLNRGLSLSLPYFDDAALALRLYPVEVIPNGRIMFVPAFVVLAMRLMEEKINNDNCLNPSTRKHLLAQLKSIENVFWQRSYQPDQG